MFQVAESVYQMFKVAESVYQVFKVAESIYQVFKVAEFIYQEWITKQEVVKLRSIYIKRESTKSKF